MFRNRGLSGHINEPAENTDRHSSLSAFSRYCIYIINFLYRWLPIVCGCHCRADRSFYYHGYRFPVCARCTGEVIGGILGFVFFCFFREASPVFWIMLVPLIADGLIQKFTRYESNNIRRCWTGILFGFGAVNLLLLSFLFTFRMGESFGKKLLHKG